MTFISKSDLEAYLNFDLTETGAEVVNALAESIQASAESMLGYSFTRSARTFYVDGGEQRVWLPVPAKVVDFTVPIVATIYNDLTGLYDAWGSAAPRLRRDASVELYGVGYGPESVELTYTAGWIAETFPADLKQALIELLAAKWSVANMAGDTTTDTEAIKSISIGSLRKEFVVTDASTASKQMQGQVESAMSTIKSYRRGGAY